MKLALLWKKAPKKFVNCILCERRCHIPEGGVGFCRGRKNVGGVLYSMVYGKLCSAAIDPIEKKPFFHFLPGSNAFSISSPGCNFRCKFCFVPGAYVATENGAHEIRQLHDSGGAGKVLSHTGELKAVKQRFIHNYKGPVVRVKPLFLPPFTCTPEHRVFVAGEKGLEKVEAGKLTKKHVLVVPKPKRCLAQQDIDTASLLAAADARPRRISRKRLNAARLEEILRMKAAGKTSRQIGAAVGMNATYLRSLFAKLRSRGKEELLRESQPTTLVRGKGFVRFKGEKGKGVPLRVRLTKELARLLGLYCAEGSAVKGPKRPNSFNLLFSYGYAEQGFVRETTHLLEKLFGVKPHLSKTGTSVQVTVGSTSLALLFAELCGKDCYGKRVPPQLFRSPKPVVGAFLKGYFDGDGCYKKNYTDAISVSKNLIMGVAELLLLQGVVPGVYEYAPPASKKICGRTVQQKPEHIVRFPAGFDFERGKWKSGKKAYAEDGDYYYLPVRSLSTESYDGPVYNMEVDGDHSYTANFVAVCNCQNWTISQSTVDNVPVQDTKPEQVVKGALASDCKSIAYTYTEPTIFYEFARDVSELAVKKKLKNVFVTNGYMSREMLKDYGQLLDAANVDVKGDERFYKEICGNADMQPVLDNIKRLRHEGVWVEVTNLIIQGYNDDKDSIRQISEYCAKVDKDMPVHFTAFYPQYLMTNVPQTPRELLVKARSIALDSGVRYAYCGNTFPGDPFENTYCPDCNALVVKRHGFDVIANYSVKRDGSASCPNCGHTIAGVFA
jgi:pyruvate formate lyase activating enzyme